MKFISAEVFNGVSWDIRNKFYEWWKPSLGDVFESNICRNMGFVGEELTPERYAAIHDNTTPLLSEGQLLEFIKWRTKKSIDISTCIAKDAVIVEVWNNMSCDKLHQVENEEGDLLMALWGCACDVAIDKRFD